MKHRYASDCHSHSDCSFDGRSSMNAMCERALELGLFYYTVSDTANAMNINTRNTAVPDTMAWCGRLGRRWTSAGRITPSSGC